MKRLVHFFESRWQMLAILSIVLLAAYLRLYKIADYMTFLGDEGRDVLVVKHMIVDHKFTLLGPTASVGGFFLGPVYYYFMAPFLWAWHMDPVGPAVMVALFGVATALLVYLLGKELFGTGAGLIASLLYTLSPIVIAYSRSSWNPNLVPFFTTVLMYCLWKWYVTGKGKYFFWVGISLGIGLQLHYLYVFLFPVVFVWSILYGRSKKYIPAYALGLLGFVIGYAPFLAFELRHGFPNTISIVRFIFAGKDTGFSANIFINNINDVAFRLFGRLVFRLPQEELQNALPAWQLTTWLVAIKTSIWASLGLMVGIVMAIFPFAHKKEQLQKSAVLVLVWLLIPLILFGLYRRGIYEYYFGIFFPVPFLLVGYLFSLLFTQKISRFLAAIGLGILLYLNWQGRPFRFPPNRQLAGAKAIAAAALAKTDGKPFNFALITGQNSDHVYRYFFEIWGNAPVTIENNVIDPTRKTVTDQLVVICEIPDCKPLGNPLWEIAGFGRAEITGKWDVPFVTIYRLVHYTGEGLK